MTIAPPLIRNWWKRGAWNLRGRTLEQYADELLAERRRAGLPVASFDFTRSGTLWQDAAATTPVTASGQPIGFASDLTGSGRAATQGTAADRPLFTIEDGAAFARFGTTDYLAMAAMGLGGSPYVILAAVRSPATYAANRVLFVERNTTGAGTTAIAALVQFNSTTGAIASTQRNDAAATRAATGAAVAASTLGVVVSRSTTASLQTRYNTVTTTTGVTLPPAPYTTDGVLIGATQFNATPVQQFLLADVYRLMVIGGTVTDDELLALQRLMGAAVGVAF